MAAIVVQLPAAQATPGTHRARFAIDEMYPEGRWQVALAVYATATELGCQHSLPCGSALARRLRSGAKGAGGSAISAGRSEITPRSGTCSDYSSARSRGSLRQTPLRCLLVFWSFVLVVFSFANFAVFRPPLPLPPFPFPSAREMLARVSRRWLASAGLNHVGSKLPHLFCARSSSARLKHAARRSRGFRTTARRTGQGRFGTVGALPRRGADSLIGI